MNRAKVLRAIGRGAAVGLVGAIPVSVAVEVIDRHVADADRSAWLAVPFVVLLGAYAAAGWVAGRSAPDSAPSSGALAALGAFAGWLLVRLLVPAVQGRHLGFGPRAVAVNVLFAIALGIVGAWAATAPAATRDNGDGDEPAGRPRPGPARAGDPAEERPDSTGQGAG